jgi:RNA-binding protein 5/10
LRDIARGKVQAAKAKPVDDEQQQPKYRDRASERRVMHNQPEAPSPVVVEKKTSSRRYAPGPSKPPTPPPVPLNPGKDDNNVGNKLLKMMGWTEGSGLGTNGEGRVDPM